MTIISGSSASFRKINSSFNIQDDNVIAGPSSYLALTDSLVFKGKVKPEDAKPALTKELKMPFGFIKGKRLDSFQKQAKAIWDEKAKRDSEERRLAAINLENVGESINTGLSFGLLNPRTVNQSVTDKISTSLATPLVPDAPTTPQESLNNTPFLSARVQQSAGFSPSRINIVPENATIFSTISPVTPTPITRLSPTPRTRGIATARSSPTDSGNLLGVPILTERLVPLASPGSPITPRIASVNSSSPVSSIKNMTRLLDSSTNDNLQLLTSAPITDRSSPLGSPRGSRSVGTSPIPTTPTTPTKETYFNWTVPQMNSRLNELVRAGVITERQVNAATNKSKKYRLLIKSHQSGYQPEASASLARRGAVPPNPVANSLPNLLMDFNQDSGIGSSRRSGFSTSPKKK